MKGEVQNYNHQITPKYNPLKKLCIGN